MTEVSDERRILSALVAERDEARTSTSNLLARIHRDGGHYEVEHGTVKAVADADGIVSHLHIAGDALATANARVAELENVARYHAIELERCAIYAYDVGPSIKNVMRDAAAFLRAAFKGDKNETD